MKTKIKIKIIHWIPRILCISAILFLGVFAFDSFAPELSMKQQIIGFLMHLIPNFVLLLALIIAWKRELTGGIIFAVIGILMMTFYICRWHMSAVNIWAIVTLLTIPFPFILVGFLFILSYYMKKKQSKPIISKEAINGAEHTEGSQVYENLFFF